MTQPHFRDDEIERRAMHRLKVAGLPPYARPVCGFYHPDDRRVVLAMEKRGLVITWVGEGKDHGLLLAQLPEEIGMRAIEGGKA